MIDILSDDPAPETLDPPATLTYLIAEDRRSSDPHYTLRRCYTVTRQGEEEPFTRGGDYALVRAEFHALDDAGWGAEGHWCWALLPGRGFQGRPTDVMHAVQEFAGFRQADPAPVDGADDFFDLPGDVTNGSAVVTERPNTAPR